MRDLYDMMVQMNARMERLERRIETSNTDVSWSTENLQSLSDWVKGATVNADHLDCLFETDNNATNAFKKCVLFNRDMPIRKHKNTVYTLNNDRIWVKWDDENTRIIIQVVWQKFIGLDLETGPNPSCDDDANLLRRKSVIEMRKKLYDIKKNRTQITAWIGTIAQN